MSEYIKQRFIKLYDAYHVSIYRFLRVKLPTVEIAQDATSEVFARAWRAFSHSPSEYPQNERAYLFRVARNWIADYYRSAQRREVSSDIAGLEVHMARANSGRVTAHEAPDFIAIERMRLAVSKLADDDAQLITLRYLEDMEHREIAEITGRSEGAVRTALSRALKRLREQLEE